MQSYAAFADQLHTDRIVCQRVPLQRFLEKAGTALGALCALGRILYVSAGSARVRAQLFTARTQHGAPLLQPLRLLGIVVLPGGRRNAWPAAALRDNEAVLVHRRHSSQRGLCVGGVCVAQHNPLSKHKSTEEAAATHHLDED